MFSGSPLIHWKTCIRFIYVLQQLYKLLSVYSLTKVCRPFTLRECVERLEVLNSSSERERQLRAPIEVNDDPRMDPDYESDNAGNSTKQSQGFFCFKVRIFCSTV